MSADLPYRPRRRFSALTRRILAFNAIALLILLWVAWQGDFASGRGSALAAAGYYWHFVDIVWVFVLLTVYILPLLR